MAITGQIRHSHTLVSKKPGIMMSTCSTAGGAPMLVQTVIIRTGRTVGELSAT
jgi:hypothetical protein